jgi:selenocysteine lyase/cysteine desulfurase
MTAPATPPADPVPAATRVAAVRHEFAAAGTYLDTASIGLPPHRVLAAVHAALEDWGAGRAEAPEFDAPVAAARAAYARLVGVDPRAVAVGAQVSQLAGIVAAAVPDGGEVLTAAGEFTSIVFPFLAHAGRGVRVREVALDRLAAEVTGRTGLVSVSAVQSADGRLADLDGLAAACATTGTPVLLDLTQAAGWLPVDASRFAFTVCGGYKWLLAPRGTAFFTAAPDAAAGLVPLAAGWYAGDRRWESIYGGPLRLAPDVRRFDLSPAWHSWVGQAAALDLLGEVGPTALHAHAVGLANRFRDAVGAPPGRSAIVSVLADGAVPELLARSGVRAATRAGRLRLAFHVNNDTADADRAAEVLGGHVRE